MGFVFFALFFSYVKQTDVLARISKLEQNVELKERMEVIERPLVSGRGKGDFWKNN